MFCFLQCKDGTNSKGNFIKNVDNNKKGGKKKFKGECFYSRKKGHNIVECQAKKKYEKVGNLKPTTRGTKLQTQWRQSLTCL